jgi:predicted metalloprotease
MDLSNQRESDNVEDRRGGGGVRKGLALSGGIGAVIVALIAGALGINPQLLQGLLQLAGGPGGGGAVAPKGKGVEDGYKEFSQKLLGSTEDVWQKLFKASGYGNYKNPGMVLFSGEVDSEGCGVAPSSVGPFYCPASKKVFLDPTFFEELEGKLGGSKAEFSQAYVIAHEVGHHVQNLLRYNSMVEEFKRREGENSGIRLELQADYLAGVWAHHAAEKIKLSEKDIGEAITTAKAIGDDRIQKKMRGWVSPESFNHGKAEQRLKYFMEGFKTGDASEAALQRFFSRNVRPLDL